LLKSAPDCLNWGVCLDYKNLVEFVFFTAQLCSRVSDLLFRCKRGDSGAARPC